MAKVINSWAEVEVLLRKEIFKTMKKEVAQEVREVMTEDGGVIDREVYEKYTPKDYNRTFELKNPSNVESHMVDDNTLEIRNTRSDGDKDVAYIVEKGSGYTWGYTRDLDEEIGARPFHEKTVEELKKTGRHKEALKEGLRKRLGARATVF